MAGRQNPNQFTFGIKYNTLKSDMFGPNKPDVGAKTATPASAATSAVTSTVTSDANVSAAALKKANEKTEAVSAEYHEKLAEYEKKIEELEKLTKKQTTAYKQLLETQKALKVDNADNEKRATTAEAELKKLKDDLQGVKDYNQTLRNKLDEEAKFVTKFKNEAEREKGAAKQAKKSATEQGQQMQNTITNLTQENAQLQAQVNEAIAQVDNAHQELATAFGDTGNLTVAELLDCVRLDRVRISQQNTVTHKPSEASLSGENKQPVRSVSLQQQLDDAGYDSVDEKEEEEITPIKLDFSGIQSVETAPIELVKARETPEFTFSSIKSVETAPIEPHVQARAPSKFTFSGITSVSTSPIEPELRPIPGVWPWRFAPLLLLCALLSLALFSNLITERRTWAAANDLARRRVVDLSLSGASAWHPLLGFFANFDDLIGVGHGMLG